MGVFRSLLGLQQLDRIESRLDELSALREALARADEWARGLQRALDEERARVRELADQAEHLIEELGGTRYQWLEWKAKAADYDEVVAARDAAEAALAAARAELQGREEPPAGG